MIDLIFNYELAGIDDHILGIVAPQCQWNMAGHLKDNLLVFAFCFLLCVYFSSYASNYCHFASSNSKFQNTQKLLALAQLWPLFVLCLLKARFLVCG